MKRRVGMQLPPLILPPVLVLPPLREEVNLPSGVSYSSTRIFDSLNPIADHV
jgi:hypothetical protein